MKSKRKFLSIFAILFALVFALSVCFFAACGNKDDDEKDNDTTTEQGENTDTKDDDDDEKKDDEKKDEATVKEVSVSPSTLDLVVGGEVGSLEATVTMSETDATFDGTCEWTVEPSGIVTVTPDTADSTKATVTAVAAGEATITVTAGEKSATCAVSVSEPDVDPYTEVTTLDELKTYTESNDTETKYVRLGNDIVGTVTVSASVVLDLNGKTLQNVENSATTYGEVINTVTVTSTGSLTILDSTYVEGAETNTGSIKNIYSTTLSGETTSGYSYDSAAVIFTEGAVTLESGILDGASVGIRAQAGTVEMNGGKISSDFYAVWEDVGVVTVTINDGTIEGKRKGIYVGGDGDFGLSGYQTNAKTTLIVNGGSVTCEDDSAICTLGYTSVDSAYIEINGGELTSNYLDDTTAGNGGSSTRIPAIYLPGGTLKVTDGTISGATALEVRGGKTTIEGGTFTTTASVQNTPTFQSSGATSYGYSVAVYPFGYSNGRYKTDNNFDTSTTVTITGGTFDGEIYGTSDTQITNNDSTYDIPYTLTIAGGTFSENPSEYLSEEYVATQSGEYYVVGEKPVELTAITTMSWAMADYKTSLDSYLSADLDTATEYFFNTNNTVSEKNSEGSRFSYITKKKAEWGGDQVTHGETTYSDSLKVAGSVSTSNGRYFKIDLSGVETGTVIQVEIVFCSNSNEAGNERSGYIATAQSAVGSTTGDTIIAKTGDAGQETALSSKTTAIGVVCTYTVLGEDGEALYLWADQNARYCGVNLTVSE